jgi:hypothetical protein
MRRFIFVMLVFCSLLLSWLLTLRLVVLCHLVQLLLCHLPHLRLFLRLLVVRVLVFAVIIVVMMDMWRHSATGRRKLRRLRLTVLHRVLVLEDLRGVLLIQTHKRLSSALSPCDLYVIRSCWFCGSALCTYRLCYCFSVFYFGTTLRSFFRYCSLVSRFWCFLSYDSSFCSSFYFASFLSPLHCSYHQWFPSFCCWIGHALF